MITKFEHNPTPKKKQLEIFNQTLMVHTVRIKSNIHTKIKEDFQLQSFKGHG